MNLSDEIRKQIEKNKGLKLAIGEINNNLSILEELVRKDIMEQVDEAYQKGYDKGYADKTNNIEVCNKIAKDNQDEAYQRGLDDAWEAARKVVLDPDEGGTSLPDLFAMFGNGSMQSVFRNYSASEAIAKLKGHEEKRKSNEEIKVRDEVMVYGNRGVVTYICGDVYTVMMYDGSCGKWVSADLRKTGKQHDIDKILEEMRA